MADLEEGFEGEIALTVENLPQGLQAFPGTEVGPKSGGTASGGYESYKAER